MLAAGFTTTTDTLSYALMLLSVFPSALQKLRKEHNRVFPPDIAGTLQLLRSDPSSLTKSLPYTAAVIQETLRLFPVGMVVRAPPKGMTSFELGGRTYPVKPNHYFGIMAYSVHYDPEMFSEPSCFRPERFLDVDDFENDSNDASISEDNFDSNSNSGSNSNTNSISNSNIDTIPNSNVATISNIPQTHNNKAKNNPKHPKAAYRPFERGPRQCIGQTLATSEILTALVILSRHFDFTLTNHNPVATPRLTHTDLDTKLGNHAFQESRLSAGTNGEVLMLVTVPRFSSPRVLSCT